MLRVDLAPFDNGLHELELEPTAADLDLDPEVFHDIAIALRLDVHDRRVRAAFVTRATATLECDRTLNMYQQPIEGTHEVLFTTAPIAEVEEDIYPFPEQDQVIVLTEPVRDTMLLSLPVRRVSPEAEEAEIPTRFGGPDESVTDTRWEALRRLLPPDEGTPDLGDDS